MGADMRSFALKVFVLTTAVVVAAQIPEDEVSSGLRTARSITNIARLLLGGNVPPDHPLVKYPDTLQAGSEKKLIAAVPGMNGKKPEFATSPSFPVAVPSSTTQQTYVQQTPQWPQTNQGYIAPPVQQAQLLTSQQANPAGLNAPSNYYNAPPNAFNAPVNSYPAPGNPYNAPYNGGGGSSGPLIATNGNFQQHLQQQQQQQPYASATGQGPVYANSPYQPQAPLYNPNPAQQQQYPSTFQGYPPPPPVYQPPQGSYPQAAASTQSTNQQTPQTFFQGPYSGQANSNGAQSQSYYGGGSSYLNNGNNNNNPVPVQSYSSLMVSSPNSVNNVNPNPPYAPSAPLNPSAQNLGQYPQNNFNPQNAPLFPPPQPYTNFAPTGPQTPYNPGPQVPYPPPPTQNPYNNPPAPYNSQNPGSYPAPSNNYNQQNPNNQYNNPTQNNNPQNSNNQYNNNPTQNNYPNQPYPTYPQTNNYIPPYPSQAPYNTPPPSTSYNNAPYNYQQPPQNGNNYYPQQQQQLNQGGGNYQNYGNNPTNNYNNPQSLNYNSGSFTTSTAKPTTTPNNSNNNQYRGGHTGSKESSYNSNNVIPSNGKLSSKFKQSHGGHEPSKSSFHSAAKPTSYYKSPDTSNNKYGRQQESKTTSRSRYQNRPSYPRHDFSPKILDESDETVTLAGNEPAQQQQPNQSPTPVPTRPYRSTDEYEENYHGLAVPASAERPSQKDTAALDTDKIFPDTSSKSDFVPSLTLFSASYVV